MKRMTWTQRDKGRVPPGTYAVDLVGYTDGVALSMQPSDQLEWARVRLVVNGWEVLARPADLTEVEEQVPVPPRMCGTVVASDDINCRVKVRIPELHEGVSDADLPWLSQREMMSIGVDAVQKPTSIAGLEVETTPIERETAVGWNHNDLPINFWRRKFGGDPAGIKGSPLPKRR